MLNLNHKPRVGMCVAFAVLHGGKAGTMNTDERVPILWLLSPMVFYLNELGFILCHIACRQTKLAPLP